MSGKNGGGPNLTTYIRARYPVIVLETFEERRAQQLVLETAAAVQRKAYFWSVTQGLVDAKGEEVEGSTREPEDILKNILEKAAPAKGEPSGDMASAIYLIHDIHPYLNGSPVLQRRIRDLVAKLPMRRGGATVVFCSPHFPIPDDLQHEVTVLDIPLPTAPQLSEVLLRQLLSVNKVLEKAGKTQMQMNEEEKESVIGGMRGLTTFEAENVLSRSFAELQRFDAHIVTKEKELVVKRSGVLSVQTMVEPMENVGGLDNIKAWLYQRKRAFSEEARSFGLPVPKGMLVVGFPGTGKSLLARATASIWGLPTLDFSPANIMGSKVGESETAVREAWATAEAIAPCVMRIDEAEKAFMGHDASNDSGVMSHIVSHLLTKMQERKDDDPMVFVLATANRFDVLPEAMLRKGRFDELWWVDIPNLVEREAIFRIHLRKRRRAFGDDLVKRWSAQTTGFIGSEIEQVVTGALYRAFEAGRDVKPEDIEAAIGETVPLTKTKGDSITADRAAAKGKLRPASPPEAAEQTSEGRVVELM